MQPVLCQSKLLRFHFSPSHNIFFMTGFESLHKRSETLLLSVLEWITRGLFDNVCLHSTEADFITNHFNFCVDIALWAWMCLCTWSFPSLSMYWKSLRVWTAYMFSRHCWATRSEPVLIRYSIRVIAWWKQKPIINWGKGLDTLR